MFKVLFCLFAFFSVITYQKRKLCHLPLDDSVYPNRRLFKVNNANTRKMCEICSEVIIKGPEERQ